MGGTRCRLRARARPRVAAAVDSRSDGRVAAEIPEAAAGDRPGSSCSSGSRSRRRGHARIQDTIPDSTQHSSTSGERSRSARRGTQVRVQQHTAEQIVNRPRVRISERIVEQTKDIPRSSARISERIEEQTVDIPRSSARILERIEEQTVDVSRSCGRFSEGFRPQRVCRRFIERQWGGRGCFHGDGCTFAHSWAELHPEGWRRTSTRKG